jgi:protein-tyrosine phosphatase
MRLGTIRLGVWHKYVVAGLSYLLLIPTDWQLLRSYFLMVHFLIAALMMGGTHYKLCVIGKRNGKIPLWSYIVWFPFHFTNTFYCGMLHLYRYARDIVPPASEVAPRIWLGGKYSHLVEPLAFKGASSWAAVVDVTVEFSETANVKPYDYMQIAAWDGQPPLAAYIEAACVHTCERLKSSKGPVLVHCAYGVGRSTLVLCALLVKAGVCENTTDAFNLVKSKRRVAHLNAPSRARLDEWERDYHKKTCRDTNTSRRGREAGPTALN